LEEVGNDGSETIEVVFHVGELNSQFAQSGNSFGFDFNEFGSEGSLVGVDQVLSGSLEESDDGSLSLESVSDESVPLLSVGFDEVGERLVVVFLLVGSVDELLVLSEGVLVGVQVSGDSELVFLVGIDVTGEDFSVSFASGKSSLQSGFLVELTFVSVLFGGGEEFDDFSSLEVGSSCLELEVDSVEDVSSFFGLIHQLEK
jgi:hypothetical protein